MKNKKKYDYFVYSKDTLNSVIFLIPFVLIYELFFYFIYYNKDHWYRNTAEVYLYKIFLIFEPFAFIVEIIFFILFILIAVFLSRRKFRTFQVKPLYFFMMIIEGLLFSLLLILLSNDLNIFSSTNSIKSYSLFKNFCDGISAGIREEILFRAIILTLILFIINKVIKESNFLINFLGIFISALLFSLFHYYGFDSGFVGDEFILSTFQTRLIAGIFLGYLYFYRGLGVVCMCHIGYNFLLDAINIIN